MDGIEFKELFKVATETLREKTIHPLLKADTIYQQDSENEGIAETDYLQLDLTEEQRNICKGLYSQSRKASVKEKEAVKAQIADISKRLGEIRKEVRLLEGIAARSDTLKEKLNVIRAEEQETRRKELMKNEHRRRCGGTDREDELRGI